MPLQKFPAEVIEELRTYVYRLIDPRNGETFYVGKGSGNRVFAHAQAALERAEEQPNSKLKRIREIIASGFKVAHVIHRHGMDDDTAFHVESALIDAYPGLTNLAGGHGGTDFGVMHATEIVERYAAEEADFVDKALLISINNTAAEQSFYEAVRYAWKINPKRAQEADVVLATRRGLIVAAFVAEAWLPATQVNFPDREPLPDRYGFVGRQAPSELITRYVRKRVPDSMRKPGASNPIKYSWV